MIDPIVKAKVENGIVVEAFLLWEIPSHLHAWLTAPPEVGPGWTYDGTTFAPPTDG